MKYFKTIFLNIIFIAIILTIIYFMYNYKIYIIASGSMEPTYKIDEMIIVKKSKKDSAYEKRRGYNFL